LEQHYLAIKAPKQLIYNALQLDMEIWAIHNLNVYGRKLKNPIMAAT